MALTEAILRRCGVHRSTAVPPVPSRAVDVPSMPDVGLRRVEWVRLLVGPRGTRAEAVGVGHRLPAAIPVSLRTATQLMRAGTPLIVRHVAGSSPLSGLPADSLRARP